MMTETVAIEEAVIATAETMESDTDVGRGTVVESML
jgi:hypothetical protein